MHVRPALAALDLGDHAPDLVADLAGRGHRGGRLLDQPRLVQLLRGLAQALGQGAHALDHLAALGHHPADVLRLLRVDGVAGLDGGRRHGPHAELDDLVAEQSLRLEARHRVLAHAIGELPADGQVHPDLAPRLGGQAHARHPADLHAGQPHGRALHQAADLAELGVDGVARLEQARARPQRVDHAEKGGQPDQHEHAHPQLLASLLSFLVHDVTSPRRPGTPGRPDGRTPAPRRAGPAPRTARRSARPRGRPRSASARDRGSPRSQCRRRPPRSRTISSATRRELVGSRPAVGSSKSSIAGSPIERPRDPHALAHAARQLGRQQRRAPPDRARPWTGPAPRARGSRASPRPVCSRSGYATFSRTVSESNSAAPWNT